MSLPLALPYESYVPDLYLGVTRAQFLAKVRQVASQLTLPPEWLMVIMYRESQLKPWAKSPLSTATGLIQWLESTATKTHGVTTAQIAAMNGLEQMDLVYVYFKPSIKKIKCLTDAYLIVHYPVAANKGVSYVLYAKGSKAYAANSGLDLNGDGKVTVGEVGTWLTRGTSVDPFAGKTTSGTPSETAKKKVLIDGSTLMALLCLLVLGAAAYYSFSGRWGQVWTYTKLRTKQLLPL